VDINEYISSGVLELYVAGALSPSENREVEEMAGRYSEVRNEIDAIEAALEALVAAPGINPRPELRAMVLDSIDHLDGSARRPLVPAGNQRASVIAMPSRMRYLMAASIAISILASSAATYFAYQWKSTERELATVSSQNQQMAQEQSAMKTRLDRGAQDLAVLRTHENHVVQMKGLPVAPGALATVYWNPKTHEVHLDKGSLPAPPPGRQYQLWAIADGKPVDAGTITRDTASQGLEHMKSIDKAEAFAVTLEPDGGSAAPTLDAMYVMGKLGT
jgi:anti-sigma-K factor RskA